MVDVREVALDGCIDGWLDGWMNDKWCSDRSKRLVRDVVEEKGREVKRMRHQAGVGSRKTR